MNWIKVAVKMKSDPRIGGIAAACKVRVPEAVGLVCCVLMELPDHARDGDVAQVDNVVLEQWAGWCGDMGAFGAAFRQFLCDESGTVRAWEKHNGAAIRESQRASDRAKEYREERRRAARERSKPVPNVESTGHETHTYGKREGHETHTYGKRDLLRNETRRDETNYITTTTSGTADAAPPLVLELDSATPSKASKKPPTSFPNFPIPLCQQLHGVWVSTFGACDYPRFRKEFGPLFTLAEADRPADAPTNGELAAALKSYADLAPLGAAARFANVNHAAGCLAAIARTRRELADDPSRRSDAVMRIIHGRAAA